MEHVVSKKVSIVILALDDMTNAVILLVMEGSYVLFL